MRPEGSQPAAGRANGQAAFVWLFARPWPLSAQPFLRRSAEPVLEQSLDQHGELFVFIEEPFPDLAVGIAPNLGRDAPVRGVAAFPGRPTERLGFLLGCFHAAASLECRSL